MRAFARGTIRDRWRAAGPVVLVTLAFVGGCGRRGGPPRYPVSGSVTYAGGPLFPPFITTVDLPAGKAEIDFDVPAARSR